MLSELHSLILKLCSKQYNKNIILHLIVAPQQSSGRQHNYSTKTRQAGYANEQSMNSLMSAQQSNLAWAKLLQSHILYNWHDRIGRWDCWNKLVLLFTNNFLVPLKLNVFIQLITMEGLFIVKRGIVECWNEHQVKDKIMRISSL